ncbi:hypothetical protein LDC_1147 [sediment metagenome]|uniref:DUF2281 domain-containing protein n=1 Tax=sediment metagenome TaxID=749907 RepID=D9PHZ3_9ZZZZ
MYTEQNIIEKLKKLPPQQIDEVIRFIDSITEITQGKVIAPHDNEVKNSIQNLRGRGKGEHLVKRLLQSRHEDKRLD